MEYYYLTFLAVLITLGAEIYVNLMYSKYSKVKNKKKLSGFDAAKKILASNNLDNIYVVETTGVLTDHYDPKNNVIRLSRGNFNNDSISAVAVAAHEAGHAIQNSEGNFLLKVRSVLIPFVSFSSKFSYIVIVLGLILGYLKLFYFGIALMLIILLFQLVTLPIEIDASKKGLKFLLKYDILDKDEISLGKKVLIAAALTYVASIANTLIEILRLLIISGDRN